MTNSNTLREAIIKLLYEEAPDTPWLTDAFYDKLLSLIENECQKREKKNYSAHMINYSKTVVIALFKGKVPAQPMKERRWMTFYDPGYSINDLRAMYPSFFFSKSGEDWYKNEEFSNLTEEPRMRTMMMDVHPDSFNKTWDEQRKLCFKDEEVPLARQVLMGMAIHFLESGEYLFGTSYVRCSDKSSVGRLVGVGKFAPGGVLVVHWRPNYSHDALGVVLARKVP